MDLQDEVLKPDDSEILFATDDKRDSHYIRSNNNYQDYLRKASMLLLSVSVLSLLLSFFTGLSFLHSYTCYISTFLVSLIAQTLERKYMFLLCNGILVFIARTSGFCGGYLASAGLQTEEVAEPRHRKVMNNVVEEEEEVVILQPAAAAAPVDPLHGAADAEEQEREDSAVKEVSDDATATATADLAEDIGDQNDDEEIKEQESEELIGLGGEEDDGESEGPSSNTEELNKKIEEFIRKMKEELKLEAAHQQQHQIIAA